MRNSSQCSLHSAWVMWSLHPERIINRAAQFCTRRTTFIVLAGSQYIKTFSQSRRDVTNAYTIFLQLSMSIIFRMQIMFLNKQTEIKFACCCISLPELMYCQYLYLAIWKHQLHANRNNPVLSLFSFNMSLVIPILISATQLFRIAIALTILM